MYTWNVHKVISQDDLNKTKTNKQKNYSSAAESSL